MSRAGGSSWRWPSKPKISKSKEPYLQRTVSVTDLHDDLAWCWKSSPPSPTESLLSAASRSATPRNPWRSNPTSPKPSIKSPSAIWSEAGAPPDFSRCTTPVGPLKRPSLGSRSSSESHTPTLKDITPPAIQTSAFSPEAEVKTTLEGDIIISPTLVSQLRLLFPSLLSRQGWERQSSQRAYGWALQNPKVAILFLACDDLASWRRAVIFGLEDGMLPFKESDLDGVAADPKRVVSQQWRVLVKQLPLNGSITELENKDALALRSISLIKERPGQTIDKVKWLGSQNSRIYVRKVIQYPDEVGKLSALDQIRSFRRLKHANLLSLTCAYGQGMSVAAITPVADCDLEAFLNTPSNTKRPERLLGWINDLTQALEHLHASDLLHRHIRPTKVLVDSSHRVLFSFLGLAGTPQLSPTFSPHQYTYAAPEVILRNKYSPSSDVFSLGCLFLDILTAATQPTLETPITDFASFRAASAPARPEPNPKPSVAMPLPTTTINTSTVTLPSSSSSSAATATSASTAATPSTTSTTSTTTNATTITTPDVIAPPDASFHAHLDRVQAWMKQLRSAIPTGGDSNYQHQALTFVAAMLAPERARRPRTRTLAAHVGRWDEVRRGGRRRSES